MKKIIFTGEEIFEMDVLISVTWKSNTPYVLNIVQLEGEIMSFDASAPLYDNLPSINFTCNENKEIVDASIDFMSTVPYLESIGGFEDIRLALNFVKAVKKEAGNLLTHLL